MLKVLDGAGRGRISDVIAALDYVVANKAALNIRIVNLSVSTGVYESYDSDPLTLAARRAVTAGHRRGGVGGEQRPQRERASRSTAASPRPATRPGC